MDSYERAHSAEPKITPEKPIPKISNSPPSPPDLSTPPKPEVKLPSPSKNGNKKCYICGSQEHLRRYCPNKKTTPRRSHRPRRRNQRPPPADRAASLGQGKKGKVYLTIQCCTKKAAVLLDTGCAHSICGRNIVPTTKLEKTDRKIYTANGEELPLLGQTTIHFQLSGILAECDSSRYRSAF